MLQKPEKTHCSFVSLCLILHSTSQNVTVSYVETCFQAKQVFQRRKSGKRRFVPFPHSANVICLGKTKSARFFSPKRCGSQSCAGSPLTSVDFRSKPEMGYYLLKMKMISCRFRRRCKGMGTSIFATIQKRVSLLSSPAGRCVLHCAAMSCVVSPHFASSFRRALGLRSLIWSGHAREQND